MPLFRRSTTASSDPLADIPPRAVARLAEILARPPQHGVSKPSQQWLERQEREIATLSPSLGLRRDPRMSLTAFFGLDRLRRSSRPCRYHTGLQPSLQRWVLEQLKYEATAHLDRIRAYRKRFGDECPDDVKTLVDNLGGIASLYMSEDELAEQFDATGMPPDECLLGRVPGGCPACIVAAVGARAELLVDLRANMLARAKRREPRLLPLVEEWIACFGPDYVDDMLAESDELAAELRRIRGVVSEWQRGLKDKKRQKKKGKKQGQRRRHHHHHQRSSHGRGAVRMDRSPPRPASAGAAERRPPSPPSSPSPERPSSAPHLTGDPLLDNDPLRDPELDALIYEDPRDEIPPRGRPRSRESSPPRRRFDFDNYYSDSDDDIQDDSGVHAPSSNISSGHTIEPTQPPLAPSSTFQAPPSSDARSWVTDTVHTEIEAERRGTDHVHTVPSMGRHLSTRSRDPYMSGAFPQDTNSVAGGPSFPIPRLPSSVYSTDLPPRAPPSAAPSTTSNTSRRRDAISSVTDRPRSPTNSSTASEYVPVRRSWQTTNTTTTNTSPSSSTTQRNRTRDDASHAGRGSSRDGPESNPSPIPFTDPFANPPAQRSHSRSSSGISPGATPARRRLNSYDAVFRLAQMAPPGSAVGSRIQAGTLYEEEEEGPVTVAPDDSISCAEVREERRKREKREEELDQRERRYLSGAGRRGRSNWGAVYRE